MTTPRHLVASATAQLRATADSVVGVSVWSMDASETAATLVELTRLEAQISELRARVAAHADELGVGTEVGATSTANWLDHHTKNTRPVAASVVRLGYDLATGDRVRDALARGDLHLDQARVIIRAVTALPDDLDPDLVAQAEAHLVAQAREWDAGALKRLGDRILDVIAPEVADAHEARLLEREEHQAAMACRFTMSDDGHGTAHGRFAVPTVQGAMLRKMLQAIAAPKHQAAAHGPGVERRPGPQRMGQAFCELIERIPAQALPKVGGTDATVVVTLSYESLVGQVEQAGVLDTGERISPGQARRLACTAKIIPAVLGGKSEVLDLGRQRRLHTKPQRIALGIRDGGCTAEGCDCPPALCHAHHDQPWSRGGRTDLDHGRLLCPRHHTYAHDPTYKMTRHPNGKVSFHRRC